MTSQTYAFENPDGRAPEQARLQRQSALFEPLTDRVFAAAGLKPGMSVLDLGSGAGDVAMLAARIVGPGGRVVGVEHDPDAVASAQRRVRRTAIGNVEFIEADISTFQLQERFDAVVGRLVLMFVPDPAAALGHVSGFVRSGGIICMQEIVPNSQLATPETPLFRELSRLLCAAFESTGAPVDLGERLPAIFRDAGLAVPQLRYERLAAAVEHSLTWWYQDLITGLMPTIEQAGLATASQLEPGTLAERLDADLRATGGIATLPSLIGAWSVR